MSSSEAVTGSRRCFHRIQNLPENHTARARPLAEIFRHRAAINPPAPHPLATSSRRFCVPSQERIDHADLVSVTGCPSAAQQRGLAPSAPPPAKPTPSARPAPVRARVEPAPNFAAPPPVVAEAPSPAGPSPRERKRARWLAAQREMHDRLWPRLSAEFPAAFTLPAVPLAVGIHRQVLEVSGDDLDPGELLQFLRYWTSRGGYRVAIQRGDPGATLTAQSRVCRRSISATMPGACCGVRSTGAAGVEWRGCRCGRDAAAALCRGRLIMVGREGGPMVAASYRGSGGRGGVG